MNTDRIARARAACEAASLTDTDLSEVEHAVRVNTLARLAINDLPDALDALESARGALREIAFGGCCHALSPFPCVEDPELERDRWCLPCIARAELDKEQG